MEVNGMKLGETLATIRKERGYTQPQVAEYFAANGYDTNQKAISKWERGLTTPNAEQFLLLCRLFKIRDVLSAFCDMPGVVSLNPQGKKRVEEYVRLLAADPEFAVEKHERSARLLRTIPLYDLPVSAGTGLFLDSSDYEIIEVDETVPLSATFAVRVSGDSMTPHIEDQQIIYIKPQQTLSPGEIGIFIYNGDAYCKELGGDNDIRLISLNSRYEPIVIREYDELRVLGKVVG